MLVALSIVHDLMAVGIIARSVFGKVIGIAGVAYLASFYFPFA